ncbi:DUF4166 domain-containing protein [Amnibacterium flavum]|uniref:DUF4166 domain-containing protein n=1 Tax=Amnibacterium flavum TaxID=2173173 RepID=A0A2V1HXE5_9MICO|nr:DUF4166 domain-containing protein [Amnibacterium flavum]PVZ95950.1 DUF4166 domain-containing protein [Amnibacterium flavum]
MGIDDTDSALSPYQVALGPSLDGLHPHLRTYFSAIPDGQVGIGEGTWDRVGTPRRWLWPVLWLLSGQGIVFPAWGQGVPFTVVNRPSRSHGHPAVEAVRIFRFPRRERRMSDSIGVDDHGLVDRLGRSRRFVARLSPCVSESRLSMESTALLIRVGRRLIPLPAWLSPRVALTERFDEAVSRQHVSLTLTAPIVGLIYEYSGYFDYRLEADSESSFSDPS